MQLKYSYGELQRQGKVKCFLIVILINQYFLILPEPETMEHNLLITRKHVKAELKNSISKKLGVNIYCETTVHAL